MFVFLRKAIVRADVQNTRDAAIEKEKNIYISKDQKSLFFRLKKINIVKMRSLFVNRPK